MQWSICDADDNVLKMLEKEGFSVKFTPLNINCQSTGITNTLSATFNYNSDNLMVNGNVSNNMTV